MKFYQYLLLYFVAASCSSSTLDQKEVMTGRDNEVTNNEKPDTLGLSSTPNIDSSNFIYINRADYFEPTNEFYVSLSYKEGYDYESYDLSKESDSITYQDMEFQRRYIPKRAAEKALDLRGLDELQIVDYNGVFITNASFERVEYFEDMISAQYVAILSTAIKPPLGHHDFIAVKSSDTTIVNGRALSTVENNDLTNRIKSMVDFPAIDETLNVHLVNDQAIYSVLSLRSEKYESFTCMAMTINDSTRLVYKSDEKHTITEVTVSPVDLNGHPVFLFQIGIPETDVFWYSIGYFNGNKYIVEGSYIIRY